MSSREHLLVNVWHYDTDIETRTVDTCSPRAETRVVFASIETVRGVGCGLRALGGSMKAMSARL